MIVNNVAPKDLAGVLAILDRTELGVTRRRDLFSAVKRISEMLGNAPVSLEADPLALREKLRMIRPAAFGVSAKTWSTLRSAFSAALQLAGVIDNTVRGGALRHPLWAPLMQSVAKDKRLSNGLAAFANWCAMSEIDPENVTDESVQKFLVWLETRTLHLKPRDIVCRVPRLWNEARDKVPLWPKPALTRLSFRPSRKRLAWDDLSQSFRRDAEAYLSMRANSDLFDEVPNGPRRPLADKTLDQQREHLRLAASVLVESGFDAAEIASLADLIQPERFKTVLRHYHKRANDKPNAFAVCLAKTLIQAAQYHVGSTADQVGELKRLASKLPPVPFDLTPKNKRLLRQLESEHLRARLLFLGDELLAEVAKAVEAGALPFVEAQVAIALDIQLAVPLRPQNLCSLSWKQHFKEPNGPKGRLLLHIPAEETKAGRQDLTVEIPDEVALRLRWYRRHILPRLNADPNGFLFVSKKGRLKSQKTISQQITETIAERVGIHMTPHQFRHFGAAAYLEENPEDFETARAMLGHAWSKTTLIYAGSSSRRASRAYGKFLFEQRDKLKLSRANRKRKKAAQHG